MLKHIYLVTIVAFIFMGCSGEKGRNLGSVSLAEQKTNDIKKVLLDNLSSVMENGVYKYGKKAATTPETFTIKDVNVIVDQCTNDTQTCSVAVYVNKGSSTLRPVFMIDPLSISERQLSCASKYKAYIKSVTMLGKEAINPNPLITNPDITNQTQVTTMCNATYMPAARKDFLCRIKGIQRTVTKTQTLSNKSFDVTTTSPDTIADINFTKSETNNLICIDNLFKKSLWHLVRASNQT
ncbi:MAG: hypothetical protein V1647_05150, partial [Pseudomonadota bacterium]